MLRSRQIEAKPKRALFERPELSPAPLHRLRRLFRGMFCTQRRCQMDTDSSFPAALQWEGDGLLLVRFARRSFH